MYGQYYSPNGQYGASQNGQYAQNGQYGAAPSENGRYAQNGQYGGQHSAVPSENFGQQYNDQPSHEA
eukprot:3734263-Heterocapsa_arctica.AAC.1